MTATAMDRLRELKQFRDCGHGESMACCPAHDDRKASLSIRIEENGRTLLKCHANCKTESIVEALGLQMRDLSPEGNGQGHHSKPDRHIAAAYDYVNFDGNLSYQAVRYEPKDFRQRRPDGKGGWIWDTKGLRRLPYNLPELLQSEHVWIVEGEKDVESLRKIGLVGTCNTGGAGKWTAELNEHFKPNQHVVILPDNDYPGEKHSELVAANLYGKVASLKILKLEGLPPKGDVSDWLKDRDPEGAAEELCRLADAAPEWKPEQPAHTGWKLYDAGAMAEWPQDPLVWLAEPIIPKGGIGFMSAPPKDRKSLLTLDLALHMAQSEARLWLGKFKVYSTKVLYIAREDPLRRVRERALEICNSYHMPLPEPGRLQFLVRDRIHLTEPTHLEWLKATIQANGFEFLILDVINRMHPELDEISASDMGKLVSILEELNRELGITILAVDHTRKPQGKNTGRDNQEPNPFDMKGSIAKYGCADFMICLARTPQDNRMQVYCENKDSDERPHFFVDVSGKGSSEPKFTYAGDVGKLAADRKAMGEANREKVFAATPMGQWVKREDIQLASGLRESSVIDHLKSLCNAGRIERMGENKARRYRRPPETNDGLPWEQT
jgi:hypothetical protein